MQESENATSTTLAAFGLGCVFAALLFGVFVLILSPEIAFSDCEQEGETPNVYLCEMDGDTYRVTAERLVLIEEYVPAEP